MRGELQRLSSSLGAQRAARPRAETKVAGWEAKVAELQAGGEGEREGWAAANLKKAGQKVREKEDTIQRLERSVRWMEECVVKEGKVKEEVEEEVVEVEVEETVGGKVEGKVKEEVEGKVVEEKVVEEKVAGAGQWLRGCLGSPTAGTIMDLPRDPAVLAGPHPPNLDQPLLVPPESPVWTLRFLMHCVHHKILGRGRWVWADEEGIHQGKPLRVGGGGGVAGAWWWQPELPGRKRGEAAPHSDKGVKMFELTQFNVFTPDVKKGGRGIGGSSPCVGRQWD